MSTDSVIETATTTDAERVTARCKWFNNKAGYGFLTVCGGERDGQDIFVHHSAVKVNEEQYRYLVQGEYVEFDCIKTDSEQHEYQAMDVTGIKGGQLMCETHAKMRTDRAVLREKFLSGEKPDDMDEEEWTMVRQKAQERRGGRGGGRGGRGRGGSGRGGRSGRGGGRGGGEEERED